MKELDYLDGNEDCICCWVVAEERDCVCYVGRFEGNFPLRAMEVKEGTELFRSVWPVSEKNSW